jgi:phage major head subunit gpT-like protein
MGCEIWVKVSAVGEAAPSSADELSFLSLDTASPYVAEYDGANGGKTAHYMLRWVKTSGEKGPWSETISATITA